LGKLFTHVPLFTKQYNLVPVRGRWCPEAGKVTVGLASHWPCVTDLSGLSTYGLNGHRRGDEHPAYAPVGHGTFTLPLPSVGWEMSSRFRTAGWRPEMAESGFSVLVSCYFWD